VDSTTTEYSAVVELKSPILYIRAQLEKVMMDEDDAFERTVLHSGVISAFGQICIGRKYDQRAATLGWD